MMELNQGKKFVCKYCNKRFPCAKSLGGHIRTHMNNNNENLAETEEDSAEIPLKKLISSTKRFVESPTYGLRENPRKTKRFSDSGNGSSSIKGMMICKECGKVFGSQKALCGHMSCHSDNGEKHTLIMDSQSDTETSSNPSKRRAKRVKYKTIGVNSHGGSSSVSEIIQEQEDVAICLMMLSRDSSGVKKGLKSNSVADSSDNNSVVLEDKSSSIELRISIKNNHKLKKKWDESGYPSSENSDSDYFTNGPKKVESDDEEDDDDSDDGFLKNIQFKKPGKCSGQFKYDLRRRYECLTCNKTFDSHRALGGHRASHTKVNDCNDSTYDESYENDSFTLPKTEPKVAKSCSKGKTKSLGVPKGSSSHGGKRLGSKKSKGHECPFCSRVFKSGQALGGHKRSHFVGGSDDRTLVIKQESPEIIAPLIDLNLPAPVEEDAARFMPW